MVNCKYLKLFSLVLILIIKTNFINYGGCCGKCCLGKKTNSNTGKNISSKKPLINKLEENINTKNKNNNNLNNLLNSNDNINKNISKQKYNIPFKIEKNKKIEIIDNNINTKTVKTNSENQLNNKKNIINMQVFNSSNNNKMDEKFNILNNISQNNISKPKKNETNDLKNICVKPKNLSSKTLKSMFPRPPRVGLDNIGATCYMNATVQCFGQIEEFALFFKFDDKVNQSIEKCKNEGKKCLSSSFKTLIDKIWPNEAMGAESKNRHFPPNEFRQKIADMNPLFVNNQANDAKDLVNFIIMTLHEELNIPNKNNNINLMIQNQQDENEVFNVFLQDYNNNFRSKISELFYAIQKTSTTCKLCNKPQYNFQAYFFLVFPLEEVKKYIFNKINTPQNMNNINNPLINNNNMMINNFQGMNMNMNMINNGFNFMNNMNNMNNFNMNNINCMNGMNNNMCNMFNNNANFNNGMNNNFNNMNNMIMPIQFPMLNLGQNFNTGNIINNNNNSNFNMFDNNNFNMFNNNNNNLGMVPQYNLKPSMQNIFPQQINNNIQKLQKLNNNIVEILDCFEYNQKVDLFTGKDKIYCNNCGNMAEAYYQSFLTTAPKILILLLNRGVGIQFKIKLEFTTILDLTNYISEKNGSKNIKYKLIGVITHIGENGASGHFIAHCLSPIDDKWYTYNDAIVNETDNFQRNIIDLGMPYLLFYKRIE